MFSIRPAGAEIRAAVHDLLQMTPQRTSQLHGETCACCPRIDDLSPGGMAYVASGPEGKGCLGYPVSVPGPRGHQGDIVSFDALTGWAEAAEHVPPWTPGTPPRPALRLAWAAGCAPFVRVQGVEVVRISEMLAAHTIDALKERGHQPDPVLITLPRHCIEVLVPLASTAICPPHRYATCAAAALMKCPAPEVNLASGRWVTGRTWTRSPSTGLPFTNTHALAEAVLEALARWHDSLTARIEGWAGDRPTPGPHRKDTRP